MVQNQPNVSAEDQPTIAIITVNYYEKLAVDAMMTNKVTFVRHKADGNYAPSLLGGLFCLDSFSFVYGLMKIRETFIFSLTIDPIHRLICF